jgi:hypothetical protein
MVAKKNIGEFLQITNDVISQFNLNYTDFNTKIDKKKLLEAKNEINHIKKSTKRNFMVMDNLAGSNQKRKRSDSRALTNSNFKYKNTDESAGEATTAHPPINTPQLPSSHYKEHPSSNSYNAKIKSMFKKQEDNPKITLSKLAITDIAPGKLRIKENRRFDQILEIPSKSITPKGTEYKPITDLITDIMKLNDKHRYDDAQELKVIQKHISNLKNVNHKVANMLLRSSKESISELSYKRINNKY